MNIKAEQHLARAKDYIAKGEEFYRKAAEEIIAAQKADPQLSNSRIGEWFGKSEWWVRDVVLRVTNPSGRSTQYEVRKQASNAAAAKSVLRDPGEAAELVADPEVRQSVGRALDEHYTKQAAEMASRKREKEVERKGGEDEYAEHGRRQRIAEIVNVARGAASGLRFVAGQARGLALDEDETGAREELATLLDEVEGFVSMLRAFLGGDEVSDEAIAELIGGGS